MDILLKGGNLIREISPRSERQRTWLEISIDAKSIPPYPLRLPPNAMRQGSPWLPKMAIESAIFQLRKSAFSAKDIAMGYEPSYDKVGKYQGYKSLQELCAALQAENVHFEALALILMHLLRYKWVPTPRLPPRHCLLPKWTGGQRYVCATAQHVRRADAFVWRRHDCQIEKL